MTPPPRPRLLVLGGININLVAVAERAPAAGQTVIGARFLRYHGGKGANQAVAAARMGATVALVGRVGDDDFGHELLAGLQGRGVDASGVFVSAGMTSGVSVITVEADGQNRIVQVPGANHHCSSEDVHRLRARLPEADMVLLTLELPLDVVLEAAGAAAGLGVPVVLDPGPARPLPPALYRHCSVITPNETEAATLLGAPLTDDAAVEQAALRLRQQGVETVVVKLGRRGAYTATQAGGWWTPPFDVQAVDSVAAGDAFNGTLAVGLAEGLPLPAAVRRAAAAGALAVTRHGAQDAVPHRYEVEALLARNGQETR